MVCGDNAAVVGVDVAVSVDIVVVGGIGIDGGAIRVGAVGVVVTVATVVAVVIINRRQRIHVVVVVYSVCGVIISTVIAST